MEKSTTFSGRLGIAGTLMLVVAITVALVACGEDSAPFAEVSALNTEVAAQSAELRSLSKQVSSMQSEIAAAAETAALRTAIDGIEMGGDDDKLAEDYSDDIRSLESDISNLSEITAEITDSIDALPNAMSAIASEILGEHADEHDRLEAAMQKAFDEHGVAHGQLEDAIKEAAKDRRAEIAEGAEESAGLLERIDWLEQAAGPAITQTYVDEAIRYYQANGRQAAIDYYNSPESVDGQWYVFVADEDNTIIGHYDESVRGESLLGHLGTDETRYNFGRDMASADEDGKWVSYVYNNPATSEPGSKHSWVVRHDGVLFGSGWYEEPEDYTQIFVQRAIGLYDAEGLDATLEHYNDTNSSEGQWYVFVVDEDNTIIGHYDEGARGENLLGDIGTDVTGYNFGKVMAAVDEDEKWMSYMDNNPATGELDSKHSWVVRHDGLLFGSGWYTDPADYTEYLVRQAVDMYQADGREATFDYYNDPSTVDGQWYVYIIDADSRVSLANAARPEFVDAPPTRRIDPTGYDYGEAMYSATDEGKWIPYIDENPATEELRSKHAWVVLHDGLFFGSGYYE